ncbi:aldo/keto reductase [Streptomyces sp. NPDC096132]|uniref:aldo/keto reductase n=1 Tax=Streptomyces sp. NPDC096132 TaxID=3366075 RepID=UPI0037FD2CBB
MEIRTLGKTGLEVTELCIGTSALGSMPQTYGYSVDEDQALSTLRRVFQGPVRFVDTSNEYGQDGSSERLIGTVLRELGGVPDGFLVATKVDPDSTGDFSGRRVHASVRESRERLGLDRLPLVYLHDPERLSYEDSMAPGGPVETLRQLQADGVIGHLGVAGGPVDLLRRYVDTGVFEVVLSHNRYTLLDRSAGPLLDDCAAAGVAVVNAAPFASGMLAKGPDTTDRYFYNPAPPQIMDAARRIQAACERHGVPLAAAALQFSLREPRITSTVVGITRPERVERTIALAEHPIPEELWQEVAPAPEEVWLS